jgi:uncharacterized protein YjbJ (UPF0337 family)
MAKVRAIKNQIAGKAKQAVGEVVGDQDLHEEGKVQANAGKAEAKAGKQQESKTGKLNPLRRLNNLT